MRPPLLAALMLAFLPSLSAPATVGLSCTVGWQASPYPDLVGFRLYSSHASHGYVKGIYTQQIPATPSTQWRAYFATCEDWVLTHEGGYYPALTAVDHQGNESAFSPEISVTLQATGLLSPVILREELASYPDTLLSATPALDPQQPAARLFDGCTADRPECLAGKAKLARFSVLLDLGRPMRLTRARLFGDANGTWRSTAWSLSTACGASGPFVPAFTGQPATGNDWLEEGLWGLNARYVRVEIVGTPAGTQARELEVYGAPSPRCP